MAWGRGMRSEGTHGRRPFAHGSGRSGRWLVSAAIALTCSLALAGALATSAVAGGGPGMRSIVTIVRTRHIHLFGPAHRHHALRAARRRANRAHTTIVGGTSIAVTQAPWQVVVIGRISEERFILCGGTILSETKILTAAHCVFNPLTSGQLAPEDIAVGAGTANIETVEQHSLASEVRVHPYYSYRAPLPEGDDVVLLTLKTAFHYTAAVQPLAMVGAGTAEPEGTTVDLTGFGVEEGASEEFTGRLNSLVMHTGFSRRCGGEADAVFVCASAPGGSVCFGDSGSGLTLPGSTPSLIGVTDTVEEVDERACLPGATGGFANLAAPEIRDFIEGSNSPPRAPRGGGVSIAGVTMVGSLLTCQPGSWSPEPTYTFRFLDTASGAVLQQGPSRTYLVSGADVGRAIACEVLAASAGGTGVARTLALPAIRHTPAEIAAEEAAARKAAEEESAHKHAEEEAARKAAEEASHHQSGGQGVQGFQSVVPTPDAELASTILKANKKGVVTVKISCPAGESACAGSVVLRTAAAVAARHKALLTLAEASFSVPGGTTATVRLHLSRKARSLLARKGSLRVRVTITAHDAAGATHTAVTIVTLRAAPRH
jgi:hypothetical protein